MPGEFLKIATISLALAMLNVVQPGAQSSACDPELEAPKGDAFGYKQRAAKGAMSKKSPVSPW